MGVSGQLSTYFWPYSEYYKSMSCIVSDSFSCQGIILSGGQRQRISVARALYQTTNVVFLVSLNTIPYTPESVQIAAVYTMSSELVNQY